jgi:hypothetical protein
MEEVIHANRTGKGALIIVVIAVLLIWMVGIPCAVVAVTAYASWRRGRHPARSSAAQTGPEPVSLLLARLQQPLGAPARARRTWPT